MEQEKSNRGSRTGQAVERQPDDKAAREAARAAGREPVEARTGKPTRVPGGGRLEQPDLGNGDDNVDRQELADNGDKQPHDHSS
jgi:hypothetical protein